MNIMKRSKKGIVIIGAAAIMLVIAIFILIPNIINDTLSKSQVAALRSQYPVCDQVPPGMSYRQLSLEECVSLSDSFVYGEVIGEIKRYNVSVSLEDEELQEKRKANGIDDEYEFFEYSLKIIEDTEGVFSKDDIITIAANSMFEDCYPKLQEGMKVVVPVKKDSDQIGRTSYTVDGMFYVTENGYALSAFQENTRSTKSGMKVGTLLEELKK